MSKEIHYYRNIEPETAYICGLAEAFIEPLDLVLSKDHYGINADVFKLANNGIDGLYDIILERLRIYNRYDNLDLNLERDSFMPNVPITKVEGNNTVNSVIGILGNYVKVDKNFPAAKDFFYSINWYLKQPRAVYRTDMQALSEYMPELESALRLFYLFIISELIFVQYDEYVLMLVIGSNE